MNIQILKKPFYLFLLLMMGLLSCKTVKKLPATIAGASRAKLVGSWTLTNISYDGLLPGSVQSLFGETIPDLNGGIWKLTNSGNGSYTLSNGNAQSIYWSYSNDNNIPTFQFKKLYQGDKARKVEEGYQLLISNIDGAHMTLRSPVPLGDKTAYVLLHFEKLP